MPADLKFPGGHLKHLLRQVSDRYLPRSVIDRSDKMGFPTPLAQWTDSGFGDFARDLLGSERARSRRYVDNAAVLANERGDNPFSRRLWAFVCLELWSRAFLDREGPLAPVGRGLL